MEIYKTFWISTLKIDQEDELQIYPPHGLTFGVGFGEAGMGFCGDCRPLLVALLTPWESSACILWRSVADP